MREFIFKIVFIQQLSNPIGNNRVFQKLINIWSLLWIPVEHGGQQRGNIPGKVLRHWSEITLNNFLRQLMETLSVKWWGQSTHLVKEDSQRPYVRFETVWLRLDDLWGQIVWCSYNCLGFGFGVTENSGNTEIAELDHAFLS